MEVWRLSALGVSTQNRVSQPILDKVMDMVRDVLSLSCYFKETLAPVFGDTARNGHPLNGRL